jgi:hypothetical protein
MKDVFQGTEISLRVYLLQPTGNSINLPYSTVVIDSSALRIGIDSAPIGTTTGTPAAFQNSFTVNTSISAFEGTIDLNTSGIDTLIGSNSTVDVVFSMDVDQGTGVEQLVEESITVKAQLMAPGATGTVPNDNAIGENVALGTFVKKVGDDGERIMLKDSTGTYGVFISVGSDGEIKFDKITL